MKKFGVLREKIPFLAVLSCCVVVFAISGAVKSAEEAESTMAQAVNKQVVLLDAGHGGIDSAGGAGEPAGGDPGHPDARRRAVHDHDRT